MKNKQIQKNIKKSFFVVYAVLLIFAAFGVTIAAADTSVAWTKDIGDVTAADMSEDGSVIYAAVGSQVFVYDSGGIQQNVFTVGGNVVKLVCTADGSKAVLYTDGNVIYYINNGQITWNHTFAAITDIDISTAGSVLIVEGTQFHKYLSDGSLEYDSASGTYNLGVIDPSDEFAIVQSGNADLKKYILTTTDQYWAKSGNTSFNQAFKDYQNLLILYTNETSAIILTNQTLGGELWNTIYANYDNPYFAVSDSNLNTTNAYNYWDYSGILTTEVTNAAGWSARYGASTWVYNDLMWIAGGSGSDVWYSSDGVTWTQATNAAGWLPRLYASSWVYNDLMWIAGGERKSTTTNYLSDVWYSSDGVTWTQATGAPGWSARFGAASGVYNDLMWIAGGRGTYQYHDVWYSSDGVTWTQATNDAGWSPRYGASSWVYNDLMWIAGGYGAGSDVWCWDSNMQDRIIIQPKEGSTYLFYNYTGSDPQHTQTPYSNLNEFIGTTELRTKPILSIYDLQTTKSLTGNIQAISLSDRGDWLGTATTTNIYHDQITSLGFGTEYYAALGSTGTVYDVATANSAAMSVVGQGQITDIYSMSASRVGTYTAGGAVTHVDIADKNALWAASGGEDGKVYVFSKDASSNWYLEYSSDSENPITALRMSARGEYILAGRTNSLTLYQTNTPEVVQTDFWFTLYAYKDSDSYRNAAVNVSVYSGNQWNPFSQGFTDSIGKYVVQLTAGQTYKFDIGNGQKMLVYTASPTVTSQTVSIYSSPITTSVVYNAVWDDEIGGIKFDYTDSTGETQTITVKIQRTDNWDVIYDQTFTNQQDVEEVVPIIDDTTSYKVSFSINRKTGMSRNTYYVSASRDIVPIPLDQNLKNVLFSGLLMVLAGLFSYLSAIRGAVVVSLAAVFFVYLGWLTIPWHWLIIAIVISLVAGFTQRRG